MKFYFLNTVLSTGVAIRVCMRRAICIYVWCVYASMNVYTVYSRHRYCTNVTLYFVATCKRPFGLLLLNKIKDLQYKAQTNRNCYEYQPAKYLCQRSFSSKVNVRTHTQTNKHTGSKALRGPPITQPTTILATADDTSLPSAAAVTCAIMKPELSPPSLVRNAGKSLIAVTIHRFTAQSNHIKRH